ncbi:hypothetical protein YA0745_20975 [Pseudomonas synxantha]|uniref:Mobile element protein n=1 Tax=Pseudomonas synxantha TaxID=47883 RepID=A0ABS0UPJ2_9PSED|nr:hypothetical protein [Pseudomonas synxantha]MBI6567530.1 hypothetical protein [Pseudomonas synxantha]MBI6582355.1 hypothetical protein [Pseudomonas synxantha]MBI6645402.1 hypothetical protein [Pseudomonas synxantha]
MLRNDLNGDLPTSALTSDSHTISGWYEVERQVRGISDEERWRLRKEMVVPIIKDAQPGRWGYAHRRVSEITGLLLLKCLNGRINPGGVFPSRSYAHPS